MAKYRIGVDTGGTFSDFVVFNEDTHEVSVTKVPSTPKTPFQAIINGVSQLVESGIQPRDITFFSHGTTVGTNALLEGKGAKVGLLLTEGFDAINAVNQVPTHGPSVYIIFCEAAPPLVLPRYCKGIRERVDFKGNALIPLDKDQAREKIRELKAQGVESIAVSFLFSFMNPNHELEVAELIKEEYPTCSVSLSYRILPQIREYTRTSTTVVNALLAPVMGDYLTNLESELRHHGLDTNQLYVMQSNGGVTTFEVASKRPVPTVFSGPAGGVIAGGHLARMAGFNNVITLDMGGTSCDMALIEEGQPIQVAQGQIGKWAISVPMLEIKTIGAGGGTIAWEIGRAHV